MQCDSDNGTVSTSTSRDSTQRYTIVPFNFPKNTTASISVYVFTYIYVCIFVYKWKNVNEKPNSGCLTRNISMHKM